MIEENPTLLEDMPPLPGEAADDGLPPLALSSNPQYPNAIVKRPPNTHAKTSVKSKNAPAASTPTEGEAKVSSSLRTGLWSEGKKKERTDDRLLRIPVALANLLCLVKLIVSAMELGGRVKLWRVSWKSRWTWISRHAWCSSCSCVLL